MTIPSARVFANTFSGRILHDQYQITQHSRVMDDATKKRPHLHVFHIESSFGFAVSKSHSTQALHKEELPSHGQYTRAETQTQYSKLSPIVRSELSTQTFQEQKISSILSSKFVLYYTIYLTFLYIKIIRSAWHQSSSAPSSFR